MIINNSKNYDIFNKRFHCLQWIIISYEHNSQDPKLCFIKNRWLNYGLTNYYLTIQWSFLFFCTKISTIFAQEVSDNHWLKFDFVKTIQFVEILFRKFFIGRFPIFQKCIFLTFTFYTTTFYLIFHICFALMQYKLIDILILALDQFHC